jgi:tetratricopeptide (TPR) repeat protein
MKSTVCMLLLGLGIAAPITTPAAEKPVALYPGLGSWRHPIATKNMEAQKFFDQGLTLTYSFNRNEALRSFQKAADLDPDAAMAYWGMALAQGPYINMDGDPSFDLKGACAAVNTGLKLLHAPAREQAYLHAAATWCPEYNPQSYIDAMRALAGQYPDDPDALTIYAESLLIPVRWHWYSGAGIPATGVTDAENLLEGVIRRWPQHPGANHYYLHAVESSQSPERAIASAQRLMGIVPWAGHMVHMPGHIWLVLGDWEAAATVNERAVTVDREYFAATNMTGGSYTPYYVHNLHFIVYARSMQGRKADALRAADELAAAMGPMAEAMPEMADSFLAIPVLTLVRFGQWDAILKLPEPKEWMMASKANWRYARTLALLARGDRKKAEQEGKRFDELRTKVPAAASWGQNKSSEVLMMASEILAAKLAATPDEAEPHWQRAVELQDLFVYDEPPAWYYPVRESQGANLLRAGAPKKAEIVFREGVRRSPRNGRMLFGLLESLKAQGKQQDVEWVEREFTATWAKSDVHLRLEDL